MAADAVSTLEPAAAMPKLLPLVEAGKRGGLSGCRQMQRRSRSAYGLQRVFWSTWPFHFCCCFLPVLYENTTFLGTHLPRVTECNAFLRFYQASWFTVVVMAPPAGLSIRFSLVVCATAGAVAVAAVGVEGVAAAVSGLNNTWGCTWDGYTRILVGLAVPEHLFLPIFACCVVVFAKS